MSTYTQVLLKAGVPDLKKDAPLDDQLQFATDAGVGNDGDGSLRDGN